MINTVDQLIEVLQKINCDNREVALFESSDKKQHAFAILVNSDSEAFNLWKKLRSVIDKTKMWPVLYASYCAYIPNLTKPLTKELMCNTLQAEGFFTIVPLFLRKIASASMPVNQQKLRGNQCLRLPQPSSLLSF